MEVAFTGVVVLGGLAATHFWLKQSNEKLDQDFQESIRADCVAYLCGRFGDSASIQIAIRETLDSARVASRLDGLIRIECSLEKVSVRECSQALLFLFQPPPHKDGSLPDLVLGKTERSVAWRNLPKAIRDEFLANANQKIVILLAQAGESA
jgi:hypothetical protein